MEKVLIVAATELEVEALIENASKNDSLAYKLFEAENYNILISGVGKMKTAVLLNLHLSDFNYSFVINLGVAGSFNKSLQLGQLVNVISEAIGDLGVEANNGFMDVFDMMLEKQNEFPYKNKKLINYSLINNKKVEELVQCNGLTVNSITSCKNKIKLRKEKYDVDVESMEGAAVFYSCLIRKIPFVSIKAISNYVGETDKSKWKLQSAIENLNNKALEILKEIYE